MKFVLLVICSLTFSQIQAQDLTENIDKLYTDIVTNNGLIDYKNLDSKLLNTILADLSNYKIENFSDADQTAFYINAYNVSVISLIIQRYDKIKSVQDDGTFFKTPIRIANQNITLDAIEKKLLKLHTGGDIHMVLNCGAVSCPPFFQNAFVGATLDEQIANAVANALKSKKIIDPSSGKISKIFQWYSTDFSPSVTSYISSKGGKDVNKLNYLDYDWTLNAANSSTATSQSLPDSEVVRYYSSNLYGRGAYEVSFFNNYYKDKGSFGQEQHFLTSTISTLIGINKRINVGLHLRIRNTVLSPMGLNSSFQALNFGNGGFSNSVEGVGGEKSGLTAIGLVAKFQPIRRFENLTVQSVLYIPTIGTDIGFHDWESPYMINDVYFDKNIGSNYAIFLSGGLHIENINGALIGTSEGYSQVSTPFTAIYSFFPDDKWTLYALGNFAPKYGINASNGGDDINLAWDPYGQIGAGAKYFITDALQIEVLYTKFYSAVPDRSAQTYNLGVRYFGW